MAKIIKGDLLHNTYWNEKEKECWNDKIYIVHQTNCVSFNAGGLAQDLIERYGQRADVYSEREPLWVNYNIAKESSRSQPGSIKISRGSPNIVSFFAQYMYGTTENEIYDDYDIQLKEGIKADTEKNRLIYFDQCLTHLERELNSGEKVLFPFKIGCNLAGGKWIEYKEKIDNFANTVKNKNITVYIINLYLK